MNVIRSLAAVVIVSLVVLSTPAEAQFPGCVDSLGNSVGSFSDPTINDIAFATIRMGHPVILFNPMLMNRSSPAMQRFIYMHECGHHALGQIVALASTGASRVSAVGEQEADCYAARQLLLLGALSRQDLAQVQSELAAFGPGDWTHFPGPVRAFNLIACLNGDGGGSQAPSCRTVVTQEPRIEYQTQPVQQTGPCQHCGCNPYNGLCGCAHPADVYTTMQPVPVQRMVPVQRVVCN